VTASGPRVLLVLPQPPAPEGGAADRCSLGLLRGLAEHGVRPHVLAAHQHFTPDHPRPAIEDLEVLDVAPRSGWTARIDTLLRPHQELAGGPFGDRLRSAAAAADLVHLEQIEAAVAGPTLDRPAVAHLHYRVRLDRDLGPPWTREFRQTLAFARAERRVARRDRWLLANSDRVAASLRRAAPRSEVVVAPLTLDPAFYAPGAPAARPSAGLIGTGSWPTTAAAVRRLTQGVWPLVRLRVPDAQLRLAGRGIGEAAAAGGPGVVVEGAVDSAVDFLRSLAVLTYPIPRGSGMKVKVLEALALGVPVVTTPDGAEGVPVNDGVVVARSDEELAQATAAILCDAAERRQRGEAARRAFDAHLAPGPATEPIVELYRRMSEGG